MHDDRGPIAKKNLKDTTLDKFTKSSGKEATRETGRATTPSGNSPLSNRVDSVTASDRNDTLSNSSRNVIRNHSFDKHLYHDTTVSCNTRVAKTKHCRLSWRGLLRSEEDIWHSKFESVQPLLSHLKRRSGSQQSVRNYCYVLADFVNRRDLDPDELVKLTREQIEKMVQQYCDELLDRKLSKQSVRVRLEYLKTFFAYNGFSRENGLGLRVESPHQPGRIDVDEYIPTLAEALRMAERAGSHRDRAIILTPITSGLRNSSLRALRISDVLDEMNEGKKAVQIRIDQSWNERIPGACKGGISYCTFIPRLTMKAIESMLRERKDKYKSYSADEPLFNSNYNQIPANQRWQKPISAKQLLIIVHNAAKAAGIEKWKKVRVHSLRKVFNSVLRSPLEDGTQMDKNDQEYLMGHIQPGSQEPYYDRTKIERLRELYSKLVFENKTSDNNLKLEVMRQIARMHGVDTINVIANRKKELQRELTCDEERELLEQAVKSLDLGDEQDIVKLEELEQRLREGWTFVQALPNGKVVVIRKRRKLGLN